MSDVSLVWFRRDLRLADQPALAAACRDGGTVVPAYIYEENGPWPLGAAARWWLHESLAALAESLEAKGSRLILRTGPEREAVLDLLDKTKAKRLHACRRYDPAGAAVDRALTSELARRGVELVWHTGNLLREPWDVAAKTGKPYAVFTAYYRTVLAMPPPAAPKAAPRRVPKPARWPSSLTLASLGLKPKVRWDKGLAQAWTPGEAAAAAAVKRFVKNPVFAYGKNHDLPAVENGTSRLSPHLAFGETSLRQVWHAVQAAGERAGKGQDTGTGALLRQLVWREFAHHLLHHHPAMPEVPLNPVFAAFPWDDAPERLAAWQQGRTGYPLVDAGMRELWTTGWMHNRVRLVVASFLVKHLLIPWQEGERWFWDTLVDAELANNAQNWQWCAGCGVDAAPYFRVFNPTRQGERFDPDGAYVRRWVPELGRLGAKWIHQPWAAPAATLQAAGVRLGETYPEPIVEHGAARLAALVRYDRMRRQAK